MDKLELSINPDKWGNLITKFTPDSGRVSNADFTDGTININTDFNGNITKRGGYTLYNSPPLNSIPKDQFEGIFSDGSHHMLVVSGGVIQYSSGDGVFNSIVNGTGYSVGANFEFALTQDRIYGSNAVNSPVVYDRSTSYGGVTYTAPRIKTMGAQTPGTAPVAGAPTAGGAVPNGAHTYKITFLYYDSEESNGSSASGVQTAGAGNNTIPLTSIPIGGYGVTARKIYRDNNDGVWLHLTTIANNTTTTFSDTLLTGVTPTPIPEENFVPPAFANIELWVDRLFLSGVPGDPSTLFYSETDQPDIYPSLNQILCNQEDPITAIIVYYDRLIVFNRRSMGQILGKTSDTFRYASIPSSVGCVDERTLQIRVIEGVPILVWLSDRGFYAYDGNSINYISENIEDLVNFNIQQATQQKGSNTQSTQAQFSGDTLSNGIDITSFPGTITTKGYSNGTSAIGTNPRRNWDDVGDWNGGTVKTNLVINTDNTIHTPIRYAPDILTQGQLASPMIIVGSDLKLSTLNFVGESSLTNQNYMFAGLSANGAAFPIIPVRSGNLTQVSLDVFPNGSGLKYRVRVWSNLLSQPDAILDQSSEFSISGEELRTVTLTVPLTAGVMYWFGVEKTAGTGSITSQFIATNFSGGSPKVKDTLNNWVIPTAFGSGGTFTTSYSFCSSAVPQTGSWVSDIYDSESDTIGMTLTAILTGSYPSGSFCSGGYTTSSVYTLEGSNNSLFSTGPEVSEVKNNLNGSSTLAISGKRYWRLRLVLSTTDDRNTPVVSAPILKFFSTAVWESESIDTTSDSTLYNSLVTSSTIPSGTSVTTLIATSASSSGPWTGSGNADGQFGVFGSHILRRYVRIRLTITSNANNDVSAIVNSVIFKWTLVSNIISSAIDTAVAPPAGFDLFLSDFVTNGGTVLFQMRSASTLLALTSATFITVVPGTFPFSVTPFQFVQWKIILTSADTTVPEVNSVSVQWFIARLNSIRPASIFVDGRYYVALATRESTVNDILLEFDLDAKWRRHSGLYINTFSFLFNRPYFGLGTSATINKFLDSETDNGTAITLDYRSKAMDYSTDKDSDNVEKVKVVGEMILNGKNTGATFTVQYSVDQGNTFYPLVTNSGTSTFTSASDGMEFFVRFRPDWNSGNPISGRTVMYRVLNTDIYPVELKGYKVKALLRKQSVTITG